jgi:segregation and condensation protein A
MADPEIVATHPTASTAQTPVSQFDTAQPRAGFEVHLDVFEGPFDLLLGLIAKHELDITAVSLSTVTDEFISFIRHMGAVWDLDRASEFLVIAATLVDLKAARLLPAAEVEDEDDLALLEARDLLFARLLQYRAYKEVAAIFARMFAVESRRYPRSVGPEPRFAGLLPEVLLGLGPQQFAELAARALAPKPRPVVSVAHLHTPTVSVREQLAIVSERLRRSGAATFRSLTADCTATVEIVARFLALLDLFRDGLVAFEQVTALGDLLVRWTHHEEHAGNDQLAPAATDESARAVTADPVASAADVYGRRSRGSRETHETQQDGLPDPAERP